MLTALGVQNSPSSEVVGVGVYTGVVEGDTGVRVGVFSGVVDDDGVNTGVLSEVVEEDDPGVLSGVVDDVKDDGVSPGVLSGVVEVVGDDDGLCVGVLSEIVDDVVNGRHRPAFTPLMLKVVAAARAKRLRRAMERGKLAPVGRTEVAEQTKKECRRQFSRK